jgi:hypothetical protein
MSTGDLTTVLTLDEYEYMSGLRNATVATQAFANNATASLENAKKQWATIGRSMGQIGFGMQDFFSIYTMGGKDALPRALMSVMNNVQMLGAAFGPMGLAVTSVGGALASILIPQLMKGTDTTANFTEELKKSEEALDRLINKEKSSLGFVADLKKLKEKGSKDQAEAAIDRNETDIEATKNELMRRRAELRKNVQAAMAQGGVAWDPLKPIFDKDNRLLQQNIGIRAEKIGDAAADRIVGQGEKIRDLEDTLERLERRKKALADLDLNAMPADVEKERKKSVQEQIQHSNELAKREQERERAAQRIAKEIASPYEIALEKQRELQDLLNQEIITRGQYDRATRMNAEELAKNINGQTGKNEMLQKGTSHAYEAIRESVKAMQGQQDANKFLERIATNTDKLEKLVDLPDNKREVVEIMA